MKARGSGFTLVGLLIAGGLGSLLLLSMSALWVQARIELQRGEAAARLQDTGRHVLALLQRELALTAFSAGLPAARVASRASVSFACGDGVDWALAAAPNPDVALADGDPLLTVSGHHLDCIDVDAVQPDSPLLVLRRSATQPAFVPGSSVLPADGRWYLRRDDLVLEADWFHLPEGALLEDVPVEAGTSYWDWRVAIYYLRQWSRQPGDGIPTLCVEHLQALRMITECLAEGVEQWALEFGLDLDHDGVVDSYREAPTAAQLPQTRLLQVHLLLRSIDPLPGVSQPQGFRLGPRRLQRPGDGYLRQTATLTLPLTNLNLQRDLEWLP